MYIELAAYIAFGRAKSICCSAVHVNTNGFSKTGLKRKENDREREKKKEKENEKNN